MCPPSNKKFYYILCCALIALAGFFNIYLPKCQ